MTGRSCAATGQRPQRPAREMDSQPAVLRPGCRAGLRHDIPHRRRHPDPVPPSRHPVSSLALRPRGRVQTANFAVTGTLVLAGAAGWGRAADPAPASREGFKDASLVPAMGILPVRLCQPVARAIGAFHCESPCHPGQHGFPESALPDAAGAFFGFLGQFAGPGREAAGEGICYPGEDFGACTGPENVPCALFGIQGKLAFPAAVA